MTVYTVHGPPPRKNEDAADPARFVFVRDGFYFWACLLAPLWMLRRRLWLVLLLYALVMAATHAALWALGVSAAVTAAVELLIALLVGFEAASMRRWTLTRRGWNNAGIVVAPDRETAERRFFDSWVANSGHANNFGRADTWAAARSASPQAAPMPPTPAQGPAAAPSVIGLFPEPQPRP
jgi:Protein of unknown function (DUF2628)